MTINARTHVCARWSSSCTAEVAVVFCFSVCCPLGGFVPAWRLRARTFGSSRMVPAHVGVAWGTPAAATYGGLVAVSGLTGGKMVRFFVRRLHTP